MSGSDEGSIQSASIDGRLSFRAVRVHNAHLQAGRATTERCGVCAEGMGGLLAAIEEKPSVDQKSEVVEGDGGDKERDSAPSPGYWADSR